MQYNKSTDVGYPIEGISFVQFCIILGKNKLYIFISIVISCLVSIIYGFLINPTFTAKTTILVPQQSNGIGFTVSNLNALSGLPGGGFASKNSDDIYIAFLTSDSLLNELLIINELHSQDRFFADERLSLLSRSRIYQDKKSGLINIEVDDPNPEIAAKIANSYVSELHNLLGRIAVSDARQKRIYFEKAIIKTQTELAKAEASFKIAKEKFGIQAPIVIAEADLRNGAEIRSQIQSKEIQLSSMGNFITFSNPDYLRLKSEINTLKSHLILLESGSKSKNENLTPIEQVAINAYRDIKAREAVLNSLVPQYESARLEESKEGPLIQQVDIATPPERRSKPQRTKILIGGGIIGLIIGVFLAIFLYFYQWLKNNSLFLLITDAWRIAK